MISAATAFAWLVARKIGIVFPRIVVAAGCDPFFELFQFESNLPHTFAPLVGLLI